MKVPIPIFSNGISRNQLSEQLCYLPFKFSGIEFREPHECMGLASAPGALTILIDIAKVTIPALLTAIATVWSAKLLTKTKPEIPPKPEIPQKKVTVVVHVDSVLGITITYELSSDEEVLTLTFGSTLQIKDPSEISGIRLDKVWK